MNLISDYNHILLMIDNQSDELSKKAEGRIRYNHIAFVEKRDAFRGTEISIPFERRFDEIERIIPDVTPIPFEFVRRRTVHFVMGKNHLFEFQLLEVKTEE